MIHCDYETLELRTLLGATRPPTPTMRLSYSEPAVQYLKPAAPLSPEELMALWEANLDQMGLAFLRELRRPETPKPGPLILTDWSGPASKPDR